MELGVPDKEVQLDVESCMDPSNNEGKMEMALENELGCGDYVVPSRFLIGSCLRTIESFTPIQINRH